jgi:hypothetical protein
VPHSGPEDRLSQNYLRENPIVTAHWLMNTDVHLMGYFSRNLIELLTHVVELAVRVPANWNSSTILLYPVYCSDVSHILFPPITDCIHRDFSVLDFLCHSILTI